MRRRTKIVATIGPASSTPEQLRSLVDAGMDVARINLSHGELSTALERVAAVRSAARSAGREVGILVDLPGPKVRTGGFHDAGAFLVEGSMLDLVPDTAEAATSDAHRVAVDYPSLLEDLRAGDQVVLGDGAIHLQAESVDELGARCRVVTGGRVTGRPGVHLPSERLRLTAPTPHDIQLLEGLQGKDIDFIAASFVRNANDVAVVQRHAGPNRPMIIAKIETAPAVANLEEILEVTDAVMVARGDLGIECPLEDVPHLQKQIIRACVEAGTPVITATQMLESMIHAPVPTRAEVSDVANAVFDGTDAVMLSAETAIGADPALVVRTMARVAARAEAEADYAGWGSRLSRRKASVGDGRSATAGDITAAMRHAAWQVASDAGAAAILCCTRSGLTARAMARYRPESLLIGLSPQPRTLRQLALSWGVVPMSVDTYASTDELVWYAVEAAVKAGVVRAGQVVAVLAGAPDRDLQATDVLRLVPVR